MQSYLCTGIQDSLEFKIYGIAVHLQHKRKYFNWEALFVIIGASLLFQPNLLQTVHVGRYVIPGTLVTWLNKEENRHVT